MTLSGSKYLAGKVLFHKKVKSAANEQLVKLGLPTIDDEVVQELWLDYAINKEDICEFRDHGDYPNRTLIVLFSGKELVFSESFSSVLACLM